MIDELLKIIKEAEDMINSQSQCISDHEDKIEKIYNDLKEINERLNKADLKDNSTNKD